MDLNPSDYISKVILNINELIECEKWCELEVFILDNHFHLFSQGLHQQVAHWISLLPTAIQNSNLIKLQLAYALIPDQEDKAFSIFCDIYNSAIKNGTPSLAFSAWSGLADCSFYNLNRFCELSDWLKKINNLLKIEELPADEAQRNAFIAAYFNAILFCSPNKKLLIKWQRLAQTALNDSTNPETRMLLSNHLILVAIWQGDMFQARLLSKEFLGEHNLQNQNPLAFMVQKVMQAQVAWLNADKEESLRHVEEGLKYSSISKMHSFDAQLSAQAVYACMVDNDFEGANEYLTKIEKIKNPHHVLDNAQYHYLKGWVLVSTDDVDTAYIHARRGVELTKLAGVEFAESATRTLLAQIHFEKKNLVRALQHLARVQLIGRRIGSLHIRYAGLLAQAWAMLKFKREALALRYLRKAFKIGSEQEYLHIPGWPYKIMNHLCELALNKNIEPDYAKKLILCHKIQPSNLSSIPSNWPWQIELKLFGHFRLLLNGVEWKPSRKSQQRPLAILKLLAFQKKGIKQEKLADILWKDSEGDKLIQTLHTTLHRLRKLLNSSDSIRLQDGIVSLNPYLVHSDLFEFHSLLNKKIHLDQVTENYQQLIKLYELGVMLDETDAPWVIPLRDKIKIDLLNYICINAERVALQADKSNAISFYQYAILLDECSEKTYQKLIGLYVDEGLNAEAIQAYKQCETVLQKQFNVSPSQKTQRLIANL